MDSSSGELGRIPIEKIQVLPPLQCMLHVGTKSMWYAIEFEVEPFDTGLSWEHQPEQPRFTLELNLGEVDWRKLEGRTFSVPYDGNASVYVGSAHNPVNVTKLAFVERSGNHFKLACTLYCEFEFEGVAQNETIEFTSNLAFNGLITDRRYFIEKYPMTNELGIPYHYFLPHVAEESSWPLSVDTDDADAILNGLRNMVNLDGYELSLRTAGGDLVWLPPAKGS